MHPELFHIHLFGFEQTIYTYATLIVFGTLIAALYTKWRAKKELGIIHLSNNFFYLIFIAGFFGGKLFFYLQNPMKYLQRPHFMLDNFSGGFVFYGSFLVIIPVMIWYIKKHHMPVLPILDIMAVTTLIVHSIGRMGCFFGGCCYGKPTDGFTGMVFPETHGVKVHPSQLYEIGALLIILIIIHLIKKTQTFKGQLFLSYIILYAIARSVLEIFRGDMRGFIIEDYLSHSQFIGIILIIGTVIIYQKLKYKQVKI
jgi:phosphatidylglycerol:prolipoprotein diacylglycerol transferase